MIPWIQNNLKLGESINLIGRKFKRDDGQKTFAQISGSSITTFLTQHGYGITNGIVTQIPKPTPTNPIYQYIVAQCAIGLKPNGSFDVPQKVRFLFVVLTELYEAFSNRYNLRLGAATLEGRYSRGVNPIAAVFSPPGGGKSFFLDEVAALSPADLQRFCVDNAVCDILSKSVAITVTFNGVTPTSPFDLNAPIDAISLRILYRSLSLLNSLLTIV